MPQRFYGRIEFLLLVHLIYRSKDILRFIKSRKTEHDSNRRDVRVTVWTYHWFPSTHRWLTPIEGQCRGKKYEKEKNVGAADAIFRAGQVGTRMSRTRNGVKLRRGAEFKSIRKPWKSKGCCSEIDPRHTAPSSA